jgi:hypothetical protein
VVAQAGRCIICLVCHSTREHCVQLHQQQQVAAGGMMMAAGGGGGLGRRRAVLLDDDDSSVISEADTEAQGRQSGL